MTTRTIAVGLLCTIAALSAVSSGASPTGLNNIPTADVVPQGVLVIQEFQNFGNDQRPTFFAGAKYGGAKQLEVGVDDHFAGKPTGSPVVQAKYKLLNDDKHLSAALGVANLGDHARNGDAAFYVALKRELTPQFRGHIGYLNQGDSSFFAGVDGDLGKSGWVGRSDAIQTNRGHDWLASVGTIGPLGKNALVEAWASFPTQSGQSTTFTLKFNWVIGK
jgi:hypothetical protein